MLLAEAATSWSPGGVYVAVQPYILEAFGAVFAVILAWACTLFQKRTGIVVDQAARDKIQTAALNAAGRIMAAGDAKITSIEVPIHSPLIQEQVPIVTGLVKDAINQIGLTPEAVGRLIQAKLGVLQASAQAAPKPSAGGEA